MNTRHAPRGDAAASRRPLVLAFAATVVSVCLCPSGAGAYEGPTTHAALTAEALLGSRLHAFIHLDLGLGLGVFERLDLLPSAMDRREHRHLQLKLRRLAPATGLSPDENEGLFALGWVMAGSVVADMPSSANRDHFFNPALGKGLESDRPLLGWFMMFLAAMEGGDTVRQFLTGTGFDLSGRSALEWIKDCENPLSIPAFHRHLAAAAEAATPAQRRHHLALALLAMGGLLHVLQDMASPTHVRSDFAVGHLERLGSSAMDRGSAYERLVAEEFGLFGLPPYEGPPVVQPTLEAYFHSARWDGLADLTHLGHLSPGTLPPDVALRPEAVASELRDRLQRRMPLKKPALMEPDLSCLRKQPACYQRSAGGVPRLACALDPRRGELRWFMDRRIYLAAARELLPRALAFSRGFIDHLLRARLTTELEDLQLTVKSAGPPMASGELKVLAEDSKGRRALLGQNPVASVTAQGQVLARLSLTPPEGTVAVVAVLSGKDAAGDPLLAVARVKLEKK